MRVYYILFFTLFLFVKGYSQKILRDNPAVPFAIVEKIPLYPGCDTLYRNHLRLCTEENIRMAINLNFYDYVKTSMDMLPSDNYRIDIQFIITEDGSIEDIKARAKTKFLQEQAINAVKELPKMIPGWHEGKIVKVMYSLPIVLKAENVKQEYAQNPYTHNVGFVKNYKNLYDVPPIYSGCNGLINENKICFEEKLNSLIKEKFNIALANKLELSGRQRISVQFTIDSLGNIVNINSRAPHPTLEKEAIRVIGLIPKMTPGTKDKIPVDVSYNLPIIFNIEKRHRNKKTRESFWPAIENKDPYNRKN